MSQAGSRRRSTASRANVTRSFLNTTNPEIFQAPPRPGGYVKIQDPHTKKKCNEELDDGEGSTTTAMTTGTTRSQKRLREQEAAAAALKEKISREFRIDKTVNDSTWTIVSLNSEDSEVDVEVPTPLKDCIDMLSVSLSTVMLLAAGVSSIPAPYIEWTNSYFAAVKDEFGHTPPNLQGILNHVGYLQENGLLGSGDEEKDITVGGKGGGSKKPEEKSSGGDARPDIGPPVPGQPRAWKIGDPVPEDETDEEREIRLALIAGFTEDDTSAAIT